MQLTVGIFWLGGALFVGGVSFQFGWSVGLSGIGVILMVFALTKARANNFVR